MKKNMINVCKCLSVVVFVLCSCSVKHNVSDVERVKTVYSERLLRDSVFMYDSIFVKEKSDTVFITRNRIVYRDKFLIDTLWRCDTVYNVKEVFVESRSERNISLKAFLLIVILVLFLWKSGLFAVLKNVCKKYI